MFDRNFICLPRCGDDEPVWVRIDRIIAIVTNADEQGPIEGTSAIYTDTGFGVAVNQTVDQVCEIIRAKEVTQ